MSKNNVYDLFTRRRIDTRSVTDDLKCTENGKYVGKLPKGDAMAVRETMAKLQLKKEQIDALIQDFDVLYQGYAYTMGGALALLGTPLEEFDPDRHDLFVDTSGHCWIVNAPTH
jgi:hypothetical protein